MVLHSRWSGFTQGEIWLFICQELADWLRSITVERVPSKPPPADKCMPKTIAIFHRQPAAEDGGYNCCGYQHAGRLRIVQGNGEKADEQPEGKATAEPNTFF